jgi:hypothetical protein
MSGTETHRRHGHKSDVAFFSGTRRRGPIEEGEIELLLEATDDADREARCLDSLRGVVCDAYNNEPPTLGSFKDE